MRNEGDGGRTDRAQRMVHALDEKPLRVRQFAGQMEGEILPAAGLQQMVTRDHSTDDERRELRTVALPDEILIGGEIPDRDRESVGFCDVLVRKARMLPQTANKGFMRLVHDALRKSS